MSLRLRRSISALAGLLLVSSAAANMDEPGVLVGTRLCLANSPVMIDQDSVDAFGPTFARNMAGFVTRRAQDLGLLQAGLENPGSCGPLVTNFKKSAHNPRPAALLVVVEATPAAEDGSTRALMLGTNVLAQDPYSQKYVVLWQKVSIAVVGDALDGTVSVGAMQQRIARQLQELREAWTVDQKKEK